MSKDRWCSSCITERIEKKIESKAAGAKQVGPLCLPEPVGERFSISRAFLEHVMFISLVITLPVCNFPYSCLK